MEKFIGNAYPVTGGALGSIIASITFGDILQVVIFAFVGALIGLLTKELYNWCKKQLK